MVSCFVSVFRVHFSFITFTQKACKSRVITQTIIYQNGMRKLPRGHYRNRSFLHRLGCVQGVSIGGYCCREEKMHHINWLELLAP